MNRRRRILVAAGGAVLAAPAIALGQARVRRVAWLSGARGRTSPFLDAFVQGLREFGYEQGRNLEVAAYFTDGSPGRTEALANEAIGARPEVLVCQGVTVRVVHALKPQLPVVFGFSGDPVEAGFVQSLNRPGSNMTGMTFLALDLVGKRIQLLSEVLPQLKKVAVLANPQHAGEKQERSASERAARALGLEVSYLPVTTSAEIDSALAAAGRARCEALDVYPDALMASEAERIGAIAGRERLPSVSGWSVFAESGLLLSYGPNLRDVFRRIASYADKLMRGAKPGDLPVEQPTSVELCVNRRTAKALGVAIPQSILVRADRVID
jgi:putative ABC transport system substrate-binding protein